MIVVTGASGHLGRHIVACLLDRLPAERIGISLRNPAKADDLAARGLRVRRGDFAAPETLAAAFEGAEQVMIVSSNAAAHGGDALGQHRAAIAAAKAAGARRVVYTSHAAASAASAFAPARDHASTEAMLRECGLPWTSLRNGFYAATVSWLLGKGRASGVIAAPVDGKVAWTSRADLAEAAAIVLSEPGRFEGPTPPLTASAALDLADLAALAAEIDGRSIRRDTLDDTTWAARMAEAGAPPAVVAITLGLYAASRAGEFATVDPTLERLLGRPPLMVRGVIEGTAAG